MVAKTVVYKDYRQGIDLSRGRFPDDYTIFREADNVLLTTGRKARMRPPRRSLDVELDPQSQGLAYVGCGIVTIARRGDVIVHDGTDAGLITTLFFDPPDYMGGDWQLLGLINYRSRLVVAIAHAFDGCGFSDQVLYHSLDPVDPTGANRDKPSYIEDPWCPTNWNANGTRPLHFFGEGEIGYYFPEYTPALAVAAERTFINRPDGDVAFCGLSGATTRQVGERVWNPLKVEDIQDFGELWYFLLPDNGENLFRFTVSDRFDSLDDDRAWSAYVLEYLDTDGRWKKFAQDPDIPSVSGHYGIRPVDHRWGRNTNEICLLVRFDTPCTWIRWRAMIGGPPLSVLEGSDYVTDILPDQRKYPGDDIQTRFDTDILYRHDTLQDFVNDYSVNLERAGPPAFQIPLIFGQEFHYDARGIDIISEEWQATNPTQVYDWVRPTNPNGFIYKAIVVNAPGNTGGAEPAWATENLATTIDGDVTWEAYDENEVMRTTRIDFNKYRDQIRAECPDGELETSYRTNIRYETIDLVPDFVPILVLNAAEDVTVPPADYELTEDGRYIRVTWLQNLPPAGTIWTLKFPPATGDEVVVTATREHFTSGTYLFEGEIWPFQAIPLAGLPADSKLYAGIPHWPLTVGADNQNAILDVAGSQPFVVPAGVTTLRAELWGAGGGGGGAANFQSYLRLDTAAGGGGGGGAYSVEEIPVTPGEVLTVEIGAAGAGGTSSQSCFPCAFAGQNCGAATDGAAGGNTRILRGAVVLLEVGGGQGGGRGTSSGGIFPNPVAGPGGLGGIGITPPLAQDGDDGEDGETKSRVWTWPNPPPAGGGDGGFSGAGDVYGQGGDGARGRIENDPDYDCNNPPPFHPTGGDGGDGRVKLTWGGVQDPWFPQTSPSAIQMNGWQRYYFNIRKILTTDAAGDIVGDEDYLYGGEPNKESTFFLEKTAYYEQLAGNLDAGVLGSAAQAGACGDVRVLSAIQNRLAVHYENTTQLWAVNVDPVANAFLDDLPFGSRGPTAPFYGGSMVLSQDAFRFMDLGGLNYDSLKENHYGRPIERIVVEAIFAARFWPYIGSYVSVVQLGGEPRIIFFTLYREAKVMSWTTASVRDLVAPVVDSLVDANDRLYWREDQMVRYFDGAAQLGDGSWFDDNDLLAYEAAVAAAPDADAAEAINLEDYKYKARIRFHHNDLGRAGLLKRWLWFSIEQTGRSRILWRNGPDDEAKLIPGAHTDGETLTGRRHPIHMMSEGLTAELESVDLDGWELDQLILGVRASRR